MIAALGRPDCGGSLADVAGPGAVRGVGSRGETWEKHTANGNQMQPFAVC